MATDPLVVTKEELNGFRAQLEGNSYPEAFTALDVIAEFDGYLENAMPVLVVRETGVEPDRSIGDLLEKCRQFICNEEVRDSIEAGLIVPAIVAVTTQVGIPVSVATILSIYAFKVGAKRLCRNNSF